ncbi:MAG: hypothetical protein R2746_08055 [Acidimicrobiales bacterium]
MADDLAEPVLEHLVEAWRTLPPRQKLLLWHHTVLGETDDQLARRLGVAATALPVLLERARLELGVRYREVAHRAAAPGGRSRADR